MWNQNSYIATYILFHFFSDFKCDPNIVDEDGRTALHLCFIDSNHEKLKCAEYLSPITNPDITDKDGRKPNNGKIFWNDKSHSKYPKSCDNIWI